MAGVFETQRRGDQYARPAASEHYHHQAKVSGMSMLVNYRMSRLICEVCFNLGYLGGFYGEADLEFQTTMVFRTSTQPCKRKLVGCNRDVFSNVDRKCCRGYISIWTIDWPHV